MEDLNKYQYHQDQGKPSLAVNGQDVDTGRRCAICALYQSPEDIVRAAIVRNSFRNESSDEVGSYIRS